jgi:hypothetical protein
MSLVNLNLHMETREYNIDEICENFVDNVVIRTGQWIIYNREYLLLCAVAIMCLSLMDLFMYYKETDKKLAAFIEKQGEWNTQMESKNRKTREFIRKAVDDIYVDMDLLHSGIAGSLEKVDSHNENTRELLGMQMSDIEALRSEIDLYRENTREIAEIQEMEIQDLHREIELCREKSREIVENLREEINIQYENTIQYMDRQDSEIQELSTKNTENYVLIGFRQDRGGPNKICIPIFIPKNIDKFDTDIIGTSRNEDEDICLLIDQFSKLKNIKKINYKDLCAYSIAKEIYYTHPFRSSPNCILECFPNFRDTKWCIIGNGLKQLSNNNGKKKIINIYERLHSYGIELVFEQPLHDYLFEK